MTEKLEKLSAKGRKAQELINNEAFQTATTELKSELITRWEVSKDPNERERIWHLVGAIERLKMILNTTASHGKVAAAQLEELSGRL